MICLVFFWLMGTLAWKTRIWDLAPDYCPFWNSCVRKLLLLLLWALVRIPRLLSWHYTFTHFCSRAQRALASLYSGWIQKHTLAVFTIYHRQWDVNTCASAGPEEIISWIISLGGGNPNQKGVLYSYSLKKGPKFPPSSRWININPLSLPGEKGFGHKQQRKYQHAVRKASHAPAHRSTQPSTAAQEVFHLNDSQQWA